MRSGPLKLVTEKAKDDQPPALYIELSYNARPLLRAEAKGKFANARRLRQHAGRMRYPRS